MSKIAKPWKLTEEENFSSYTAWQHNMLYTLRQELTFLQFLAPTATWEKLTATNPTRGLTDAPNGGPKKEAQVIDLNAMLRYITQWVPHYLANDIEKQSTSIESVWNFIRKYYSFQQSETQFLKLNNIKLEDNERPERLYQRILAHIQDNLLKKDGKLKHDGQPVQLDEDISPTVERLAVLRWLEVLDPELPSHVARTFAHDLQSMTLKDLQPQIVDALDSFLEEIRSKRIECSYTSRGKPRNQQYRGAYQSRSNGRNQYQTRNNDRGHYQAQRTSDIKKQPYCRVCKAEGRPANHSLGSCDYISRAEKREMVHSCRVEVDDQFEHEEDTIADDFEPLTLDTNDQS